MLILNKFIKDKFYNFANVNERLRAAYLWCVEYELKERKKSVQDKKSSSTATNKPEQ